jgi:adenylate cyclase
MALEIERKFLVTGDAWGSRAVRTRRLVQGYLSTAFECVVRVRLVDDEAAFLTVKGARVVDRRPEFEYRIPPDDARFMLRHLCAPPLVEKVRYELDLAPGAWTVDVFGGANAGLVLAEIELPDDASVPDLPSWLGTEVTQDNRYANSELHEHPYTTWAAG